MSVLGPRTLRIAYWQADGRVVDSDRARLERHLAQLGGVDSQDLKQLEELKSDRELLIVAAQTIPEEGFPQWLRTFKSRVRSQGGIWTPALILANLPFPVLNDVMPEAVQDNWYFDILAPEHLGSLPIRVANLLRIHDHLHELRRYAASLDDINAKVKQLEDELHRMRSAQK